MVRVWVIVGVAAAIFYLYSIIDTALAERGTTRGVGKGAWLAIVIVLPVIGGALWFWIGRPRFGRDAQRPVAPDDDPSFLHKIDETLKHPGDGDQTGRRDA